MPSYAVLLPLYRFTVISLKMHKVTQNCCFCLLNGSLSFYLLWLHLIICLSINFSTGHSVFNFIILTIYFVKDEHRERNGYEFDTHMGGVKFLIFSYRRSGAARCSAQESGNPLENGKQKCFNAKRSVLILSSQVPTAYPAT